MAVRDPGAGGSEFVRRASGQIGPLGANTGGFLRLEHTRRTLCALLLGAHLVPGGAGARGFALGIGADVATVPAVGDQGAGDAQLVGFCGAVLGDRSW